VSAPLSGCPGDQGIILGLSDNFSFLPQQVGLSYHRFKNEAFPGKDFRKKEMSLWHFVRSAVHS
jgi:hypothetical protein